MDYKEKYEQALEVAQRFYNNSVAITKKGLEDIFPELKESIDERIKKVIKQVLSESTTEKDECYLDNGVTQQEVFAWLEKQGEQKPADKVGSKFNVGDWVVTSYGKVNQVVSVDKDGDGYTLDDGVYFSGSWCDMYHLWDITKDAKDGDVLACESGWTCIFKTLVNDETFSSYCFMDKTKWFYKTGSECHTLKEEFIKAYNGKIYPATKEQRAQLEKAMADAGYTFDFEKKELKKIEQKSAWSEEDENILNNILFHLKDNLKDNEVEFIAYKNWLKSLRPKNTWKPSDEQMEALERMVNFAHFNEAGNRDIVRNLLSQLKKLREDRLWS